MYKVTGRQKFGAVWGGNKPLVVINNGVGYVQTEKAAKALKALGYAVKDMAEPKPEPEQNPEQAAE